MMNDAELPEPAATAVEGWQALTGITFEGSTQDAWRLARWFRQFREEVRGAQLDEQVQPAIVFMPVGAGPLPSGPREPLRLSLPLSVARPAADSDLAFLSVSHLARLIEHRMVSPAELTRLYLDRCAAYDPHLFAVITRIDAAMERARVAEAEIMAGRYRGPLHGIPWGIKDWFYTQGVPTTFGQAEYEHRIVPYNATVVERLQEAGAILIAKLSPNSDRQGPWFGGKTRNPWDLTRGIADGSSAGSGAATAAGLLGFSIGEENTGSIVWPSLYCGVVGLRPTFGRVSRFGMKPGAPSMEKVGPLCRSVEDCALAFNAIYGPDGKDWTVVDTPFQWRPHRDLVGTRVGYVESAFTGVEDRAEGEVYEAALATLRELGAALIPVEFPYPSLYEQASWLTNW
jgi:Asp-tRNA(Asn)/Glu-tRNA(Gln) amidotransferase A subunit family amidase